MKSLLIGLLVLSLGAAGQEKTAIFSSERFGSIFSEYGAIIKLDKNDTARFIRLKFQNKKYERISDTKFIVLLPELDTGVVRRFVADITSALEVIGTKQDIKWEREKYTIEVSDWNKLIYFVEAGKVAPGYTTLSVKDTNKLVVWLKSLNFN